jgi:hypothetical protein
MKRQLPCRLLPLGAVYLLLLAQPAGAEEPPPGSQEARTAPAAANLEEDLPGEPEGGANESEAEPPAPEGKNLLEQPDSFGEALSALGLETLWSGYGDILFHVERGRSATFSASHFNPILLARFGEHLSAELELEFEPGSFLAEYLIVDFELSRALTLRVGRFLMPIGQFNEVLHPSFRWNMATRPLMFREVIPSVWSDTGLQLRGSMFPLPGMTLEYAVYVVNGLAGGPDFGSEPEVVRGMRTQLNDNNLDKAFGGRVGLGLLRDREYGAASFGLSGYTGAVDAAGRERLSMVVVDASLKLGALLLRGEAGQSFFGPDEAPFESLFERGLYAQATYRFGRFNVAARWDWAQTRPASGAPSTRRQLVGSVGYAPSSLWNLRAEVAQPLNPAEESAPPAFEVMVAVSF